MHLAPEVAALTGAPWPVGVRVCRNSHGGPVRIFYPADSAGLAPSKSDKKKKARPAHMFRTSLPRVATGNVHVFLGSISAWFRKGTFCFEVVAFLVRAVCWLAPLNRAYIPNAYEDLEPRAELKERRAPLVLFSHGLTGTADEHSLLAASLAADGCVVAITHHVDGSSSVADVHDDDGREAVVFYSHPAQKENYDPTLRPKQVEKRAAEVVDAKELLLKGSFGKDLADITDANRVVVGGFSFGAATAAHVAASKPQDYRCCVLWDGWFHVENAGHRFDMPALAYTKGIPIPTMFLGSEQFAGYENLADATQRLADKCPGSVSRRVQGTGHQSFCDVVFWLPIWFLRRINMAGGAEPISTYVQIVNDTRSFIMQHTGGRERVTGGPATRSKKPQASSGASQHKF